MSAQRPLLDSLEVYRAENPIRLHFPGHKGGFPSEMLDPLFDLTEVPGLDDLGAPEGAIKQAQELAAKLFGGDRSFFLVNGCTVGLQALVLAVAEPGREIILARNVHRSIVGGIVLAGLRPVFLPAREVPGWPFLLPPTTDDVKVALEAHPRAAAVLLVHPDYHGVAGDLGSMAQAAHRYNVPLLVDEAHGAHLMLHPDLPPGSISLGADAAVHGMHKTGGALTQGAILSLKGGRIDGERVARVLNLLQTSSPSYLLLASLDAARARLGSEGVRQGQEFMALVRQVREEAGKIRGIGLLGADSLPPEARWLDETRLMLDLSGLFLGGKEAENILRTAHGIQVEYASFQHLLAVFSWDDPALDAHKFLVALRELAKGSYSWMESTPPWPGIPQALLTPREAFFGPSRLVPEDEAVGMVAATAVLPYPPGVPIFWPGEEITVQAVAYLKKSKRAGLHLQGVRRPGWLEVVGCS